MQEEGQEKAEPKRADGLIDRLLKTRTVVLAGEVDQDLAERIITQLMILDADSNDPIRVLVTSQGGHVDSGFAIHDIMRFLKSPVLTIGVGWVASIAVPIMFGAEKTNRFSLPNTRFLIHQPSGGIGGQLQDIRIEAQEMIRIRERLNQLIARETGQPVEKVRADSDRNFWMTAEEALEYGLISRIVTSIDDLNKK
ncbi:MAG TPA: ATP-dependent Clp protease proteolytic subunit [Candidatus Hydrogenedentes bacterium]|nr:ATP-dependent Clp protease proteolytic subunit [Candidatus Hydrogenedentota bacterium]HOL77290.1 ATP-dependent Clp protease proteolytic subunit [Candidatus Hydrogenedentota bacterium]HPO85933.1 ATP-dependent Clp protease proteolytic subunit [Candidatus Hydrogenedentota bacterium]